jgi:hypothetical protein
LGGYVAVAIAIVAAGVGGRADAAPAPPDRLPPTKPTIDGDAEPRELRPVFTFGARDRRTPASRIRFKCGLDGATLRPCARIYRPLQDQALGRHVLRVRAFDLAGNASPITVRTFSIVGFWDAGSEFKRAPSPANPGPDRYGNTTWFFMYSPNSQHDPTSYRLLPAFVVLDPGTEVWRTALNPFDPGSHGGTQAGYSFSFLTMHPGQGPNYGQNAIVGWRSPVAATVRLQANIRANQTHCPASADGIAWSIDQGSRTLASGVLTPSQSAVPTVTTSVAAGEMLYLIKSGGVDTTCDGTLTTLTIQTLPTN